MALKQRNGWRGEGEKGSVAGVLFLAKTSLYLGRGVTHFLLFFICSFFFFAAKKQREHSRQYLYRLNDSSPSLWKIFKHFYCFSRVSVDRFFFLRGETGRFELKVYGDDVFDCVNQQAEQKGALLVLSHVGSFDALRAAGNDRFRGKIKILLDSSVSPNAMAILNSLNSEMADNIIDRSQYSNTGLVLKISEEIDQGNLVGIMADRLYGNEPSVYCEFLGNKAPFPSAPWTLSLILKAPVILCFGTFLGGKRYSLTFFEMPYLHPSSRIERKEFIDRQCSLYVKHLEEIIRCVPLNWFNFYDFWNNDSSGN